MARDSGGLMDYLLRDGGRPLNDWQSFPRRPDESDDLSGGFPERAQPSNGRPNYSASSKRSVVDG